MVIGILGLIAVRGLGYFCLPDVMLQQYTYRGQTRTIIGELYDEKWILLSVREAGIEIPENVSTVTRYSIKQGNKDVTGQDFRWY